MQFLDPPQPEEQRKPLVPHKMISGALPGATEIRIGGSENIKISGKDQQISINNNQVTYLRIEKDGIILNDGTNDRILIGFQSGGF